MDRDNNDKNNQNNNKHKEQPQPNPNPEHNQINYPIPPSDERKYSPFQDLFKPPYNYPYSTLLKSYTHLDSHQYPMSHLSRENTNPYQMPIQQHYPYGYPYSYSYPGMSYPYSMYPPYYGYRPELYSDLQHYGYPYQTSTPNPVQPTTSFPMHPNVHQIKQQIVISSDEERNRQLLFKQTGDRSEIKESRRAQKKGMGDAVEAKQENIYNKEQREEQNPFYIKHKRIQKEDKAKLERGGTRERKTKDKLIFSQEKILMKEYKNAFKKKDEPLQKEKELDNSKNNKKSQEKVSALPKQELKQTLKSAPIEEKSLPEASDIRKELSQVQDKEGKKERVKDDHPLKELRYSESHGRIRLGVHFQSSIPELLSAESIFLMRKQLQLRLAQREISALAF